MAVALAPLAPLSPQALALDTSASVWVSASAGSGKTTLLTRRVLALLLEGAPPASLLCLTYTKNAAAEMLERVTSTLRGWLTLDDAALRKTLSEDLHRPDIPLAQARQLFLNVLDDPYGGIRFQTLHSFAEALLRQFPMEADLPPTFTVLEDADALRRTAITGIYQLENDAVRAALACIAEDNAEQSLHKALEEIISQHRHLRRLLAEYPDVDAYRQALEAALALPSGLSAHDVKGQILGNRPLTTLRALIRQAEAGSKTQQDFAINLTPFINDPCPPCEEYTALFLTGNNEPRQLFKKDPALFLPEAERIRALLAQERACRTRDKALAYFTLGEAVMALYEALKTQTAAYDFDDLIRRALTLLQDSGNAAWIRFKLDARVDHILLDEAQDTSAEQWQLLDCLLDDWFTGDSTRDSTRTLFVVGDYKQSIYRFQGAAPAMFQARHAEYRARVQASGGRWHDVALHHSYRSTPPVLELVDSVFANRAEALGSTKAIHHTALRPDTGSVLAVWPALEHVEKPSLSPPFTEPLTLTSPEAVLANKLVDTITGWLQAGRVQPKDIMILFRNRREDLLTTLSQRLHQAGIPFAMPHKGKLLDALPIMDLMAAGDVALWPDDDLTLAAVLKSPLIGVSEDTLYQLCTERGERSLWQYIQAAAPDLADTLHDWQTQADRHLPSEFYKHLLQTKGGMARLRQRLGNDCTPLVDEWLRHSQRYEQEALAPSLQGFLAWLREANPDRAKQPPQAGRLRLMTIHAAKGLQARIVFLCDVVKRESQHVSLLTLDDPPLLLPTGNKALRPPIIADALADLAKADAEENERLLYVALTRAEKELYFVTLDKPAAGGWHSRISDALRQLGAQEHTDGTLMLATPTAMPAPSPPAALGNPVLPDAWREPVTVATGDSPERPRTLPASSALDYGTIVHRALQHAGVLDNAALQQLLGFLYPRHPETALAAARRLRLPSGWSEVPFTYQGETKRLDYLYHDPTGWHIVDFKSDKTQPRTPPAKYTEQLAQYRAALQAILQTPHVFTHLYWTEHDAITTVHDDAP